MCSDGSAALAGLTVLYDWKAMKRRIYTDTSVIGGCLAGEFSLYSTQLFERFRAGLDRIRGYNSVNLRLGHALLEIRSPLEVLRYEEKEF